MADRSSQESHVTEVIQSLIVAFVLAMTFRGFVVEGFVIPTGSMAPTLLGEHVQLHSGETGYVYPVGVDRGIRPDTQVPDPMLGPRLPVGSVASSLTAKSTMGDRILVLKSLFPFTTPDRFDVMVFKNPTNPNGPAGNYIKRLIGLPGETIWLADGDVFARIAGSDRFQVQRKPEHVQRAVWQPIYNSNYIVDHPDRFAMAYEQPFWYGGHWETGLSRVYRCNTDQPTTLRWNGDERAIDDWLAYNWFRPGGRNNFEYVSDIRVAAALVPETDGLEMELELAARQHIFSFVLAQDSAVVRYRPADADTAAWSDTAEVNIDLPGAGQVLNIEFWHVDQMLAIYLNGDRVVELAYDWDPRQRIAAATGGVDIDRVTQESQLRSSPAEIAWHFRGSPLSMRRVRLDRDIHYRVGQLHARQENEPRIIGWGFGTHPDNLAELGDEHFMMLGDNSTESLDSRFWGRPHPIVARQIDEAPFVVNRKLLIGKAWVVYFPAPHALSPGGTGFIPDFGRMRFIR